MKELFFTSFGYSPSPIHCKLFGDGDGDGSEGVNLHRNT